MHLIRNQTYCQRYRGFESLSLRNVCRSLFIKPATIKTDKKPDLVQTGLFLLLKQAMWLYDLRSEKPHPTVSASPTLPASLPRNSRRQKSLFLFARYKHPGASVCLDRYHPSLSLAALLSIPLFQMTTAIVRN